MMMLAGGNAMDAHFILILIACICWFGAAIWGFVRPAPSAGSPFNLEALGLFFFGLSLLVTK